MNLQPLHYLPLLTTTLSVYFFIYLYRRWAHSHDRAMLWWTLGILLYGLGTLTESLVTLLGNSIFLTKSWYLVGAILGAYPLAQGTVYLLMKRRNADRLTAVTLVFVAVASILLILSPVKPELLPPDKPSGAILGWTWIRLLTPLINGYAAVFLVGGAAVSAIRFSRIPGMGVKAGGAAMIALGGLLPGIGGSLAKAGLVEGLYVGELIGLVFIIIGTTIYGRRQRKPETQQAVQLV